MTHGSTRNFRDVDHVFTLSRKSSMYRYWYRIHGRCPRYKESLRMKNYSVHSHYSLFFLRSCVSWLRLPWKRQKLALKNPTTVPRRRGYRAPFLCKRFITESEGNCWKKSRSKGRKGRKKKELVRHRETCRWTEKKGGEGRKKKKQLMFRATKALFFFALRVVVVRIYILLFTNQIIFLLRLSCEKYSNI